MKHVGVSKDDFGFIAYRIAHVHGRVAVKRFNHGAFKSWEAKEQLFEATPLILCKRLCGEDVHSAGTWILFQFMQDWYLIKRETFLSWSTSIAQCCDRHTSC